MAIIFEYAHDFKDTSNEKVLNKILAWLGKEGAQKVKMTGPASFEAMHGTFKTFRPYEREGKKKLAFTLTSKGRDVTVNIVVKPSMAILDDIAPRVEGTRANWGALIEELWESVEGGRSTTSQERKVPATKLVDFQEEERRQEGIRKSGMLFIIMGLMDVFIFSTIIVVFYTLEIDVPLWIFLIPIIAAIGLIIWGIKRIRGPSTRTL